MKFYSVTDPEFKVFGRVLDIDVSELIATAEKIEMPAEGSIYNPSREEFEALPVMDTITRAIFGELPAQLGYCYGHSNMLNALDWHTCSEVNVAVTDMILLLGDVRDVENGRYDSAKVKAFKVKKGEAIEVYATTLHFCPIETSKDGFGCVVGLLKGTNIPLEEPTLDKLLFRKNKFLIAHEDNKALVDKGVFPGIYGENYKIVF